MKYNKVFFLFCVHLNTVQDEGRVRNIILSKDKATPYACKWNKRARARVCVCTANEGILLW